MIHDSFLLVGGIYTAVYVGLGWLGGLAFGVGRIGVGGVGLGKRLRVYLRTCSKFLWGVGRKVVEVLYLFVLRKIVVFARRVLRASTMWYLLQRGGLPRFQR